MNTKQTEPVQILGRTFGIESNFTALELQRLAKYVEEKLKEAGSTAADTTTSRIAILACLNIADELFSLQQKYDNLNYLTNKKTDEMISIIDSALGNKRT